MLIRQTGDRILTRVFLADSAGNPLATGTSTLRLFKLISDGTLSTYDFSDNTFKAGAVTTPTANLTHRTGVNGTFNTGVWTHVLSTLTGLTAGDVLIAHVTNTSASPPTQVHQFQYGGGEGGADVATIAQDAQHARAGSIGKREVDMVNRTVKYYDRDDATLLKTQTLTPSGSPTGSVVTRT
jgi:hypothetical protein